jgi:hypothetical protein
MLARMYSAKPLPLPYTAAEERCHGEMFAASVIYPSHHPP